MWFLFYCFLLWVFVIHTFQSFAMFLETVGSRAVVSRARNILKRPRVVPPVHVCERVNQFFRANGAKSIDLSTLGILLWPASCIKTD